MTSLNWTVTHTGGNAIAKSAREIAESKGVDLNPSMIGLAGGVLLPHSLGSEGEGGSMVGNVIKDIGVWADPGIGDAASITGALAEEIPTKTQDLGFGATGVDEKTRARLRKYLEEE